MEERRLESVRGRAQDQVQEIAERAGSYVQEGARVAGDQVERLTGRPLESWTSDLQRYVQQHPLQAVALTIGLGFVIGKILTRD
jgi:ElaB/YqjD/DUF883 family membrane-anchored ribosome-binding protein